MAIDLEIKAESESGGRVTAYESKGRQLIAIETLSVDEREGTFIARIPPVEGQAYLVLEGTSRQPFELSPQMRPLDVGITNLSARVMYAERALGADGLGQPRVTSGSGLRVDVLSREFGRLTTMYADDNGRIEDSLRTFRERTCDWFSWLSVRVRDPDQGGALKPSTATMDVEFVPQEEDGIESWRTPPDDPTNAVFYMVP